MAGEFRRLSDRDISWRSPATSCLSSDTLCAAIKDVNHHFRRIKEETTRSAFNVFSVIDFRMLSGLVGETLVSAIAKRHPALLKNPNIDGYPDLVDTSLIEGTADGDRWTPAQMKQFIKYRHGGIEVKNTFGTKRSTQAVLPGQSRIGAIQPRLAWKAHHRYTNHLLGLHSDFIGECPQIVAAMYSAHLCEEDWKEKQNPRKGSTMTSFSVIEQSGFEKMKRGLVLVNNTSEYLRYYGIKQ